MVLNTEWGKAKKQLTPEQKEHYRRYTRNSKAWRKRQQARWDAEDAYDAKVKRDYERRMARNATKKKNSLSSFAFNFFGNASKNSKTPKSRLTKYKVRKDTGNPFAFDAFENFNRPTRRRRNGFGFGF